MLFHVIIRKSVELDILEAVNIPGGLKSRKNKSIKEFIS